MNKTTEVAIICLANLPTAQLCYLKILYSLRYMVYIIALYSADVAYKLVPHFYILSYAVVLRVAYSITCRVLHSRNLALEELVFQVYYNNLSLLRRSVNSLDKIYVLSFFFIGFRFLEQDS